MTGRRARKLSECVEMIDSLFALKLRNVPVSQIVEFDSHTFWAPSLLWLWRTLGALIHPINPNYTFKDSDTKLIIDAVVQSMECPHSSVERRDIIRFLVYGDQRLAEYEIGDQNDPIDMACFTADLTDSINDLMIPSVLERESFSFNHCIAAQIDRVTEILLSRCLIGEDLKTPEETLVALSRSWLWLYDAMWNMLLCRNPSLAAQTIDKILPTINDISAQENAIYHPVYIVPIMRHFLFLEELVFRRIIGLPDALSWCCEEYCYPPSQYRSLKSLRGPNDLPLGKRSMMFLKTHKNDAESQLEFYSLQLPLFSRARVRKANTTTVLRHLL